MNPFIIPLQIQMSLLELTFQTASTVMQSQARLMRAAVPGMFMPAMMRGGCGGFTFRA